MNNASLALSDWNAQRAERLLKAASHDITVGATGISQATADSDSCQGYGLAALMAAVTAPRSEAVEVIGGWPGRLA